MNTFEPSPIWSAVERGKTFSSFCNNIIPRFQFSEKVPDPIKRRFTIIRKLLEFSYYEYEFIDVAMERCYHTFELALHLKFKDKNPNTIGKKNFKPYLDWAVQNNHLRLTNDQKKDLEYLRNHVIHLKEDSFAGMVNIRMIRIIGNEIINELFADKSKEKR